MDLQEARPTPLMQLVEEAYDKSTENVLRTLYLDEGMTLAAVADEVSKAIGRTVSLKTVHGWVVRFGITRKEVVAARAAL